MGNDMLVFHGRCVFSFTAVIHLAANPDGQALSGVAASRLFRLRVRIPLRACLSVTSECYVLSGRGPCDATGPITHS